MKNTGAKISVHWGQGGIGFGVKTLPQLYCLIIARLNFHVVISPLQGEGWNHPWRAPRFLTNREHEI